MSCWKEVGFNQVREATGTILKCKQDRFTPNSDEAVWAWDLEIVRLHDNSAERLYYALRQYFRKCEIHVLEEFI